MHSSQRNARYKLCLTDVKKLDISIRFAFYEGIFLSNGREE